MAKLRIPAKVKNKIKTTVTVTDPGSSPKTLKPRYKKHLTKVDKLVHCSIYE
jgi:hypothetical protein